MDPRKHSPEELESDACMIVPAGYSIEGDGISMIDIPAQKCAFGTYIGPYSGLPQAWGQFMDEWFPTSGQAVAESGICYEQYMNDMRTTSPEKLETKLFQPIQ